MSTKTFFQEIESNIDKYTPIYAKVSSAHVLKVFCKYYKVKVVYVICRPLDFTACVEECWDRNQDCCDFGIDSQTL